jgi:hypothetical protein
MEIQFDRAVVVVPLGVLAMHRGTRSSMLPVRSRKPTPRARNRPRVMTARSMLSRAIGVDGELAEDFSGGCVDDAADCGDADQSDPGR